MSHFKGRVRGAGVLKYQIQISNGLDPRSEFQIDQNPKMITLTLSVLCAHSCLLAVHRGTPLSIPVLREIISKR